MNLDIVIAYHGLKISLRCLQTHMKNAGMFRKQNWISGFGKTTVTKTIRITVGFITTSMIKFLNKKQMKNKNSKPWLCFPHPLRQHFLPLQENLININDIVILTYRSLAKVLKFRFFF